MSHQQFKSTSVEQTSANLYLKEHLMLLLEMIPQSGKHPRNTLTTQLFALSQQHHSVMFASQIYYIFPDSDKRQILRNAC